MQKCVKKNHSFNVVWLQCSVTLSLFFVSVLVLFPPRFAFSFVFFIRHPFSSFATWTKRKVIHKLSLDSLWFHKNKWEFSLEKCVETNRVAILLWKPSTDNVSRRTNKRAIPCQKNTRDSFTLSDGGYLDSYKILFLRGNKPLQLNNTWTRHTENVIERGKTKISKNKATPQHRSHWKS